MNNWVKGLAILLCIQLVGLAITNLGPDSNPGDEPAAFALIDTARVDRVSVTDADGASVALQRVAQQWQLADGLPVDATKLTALLDKLGALETGWPVTRSKEAHQRFEVDAENFQRRLELGIGGETTQLYFGTSPGYQQVHARSGTDAVYAVKLSNFEMPSAGDDWLDKGLLRPAGAITQATLTTGQPAALVTTRLALDGDGPAWLVNDQPADSAAVGMLSEKLAGLSVLGVAEGSQAAIVDRRLIELTDAAGDLRLEFTRAEDSEDYLARSSRFPERYFRVVAGAVEDLNVTPGEFVDTVVKPDEEQVQ